jgi:hypothetical protein
LGTGHESEAIVGEAGGHVIGQVLEALVRLQGGRRADLQGELLVCLDHVPELPEVFLGDSLRWVQRKVDQAVQIARNVEIEDIERRLEGNLEHERVLGRVLDICILLVDLER